MAEGTTSGVGPNGADDDQTYSCSELGSLKLADEVMQEAGEAEPAVAAGGEPQYANAAARFEALLLSMPADASLPPDMLFFVTYAVAEQQRLIKAMADTQTYQQLHARDADTIRKQAQEKKELELRLAALQTDMEQRLAAKDAELAAKDDQLQEQGTQLSSLEAFQVQQQEMLTQFQERRQQSSKGASSSNGALSADKKRKGHPAAAAAAGSSTKKKNKAATDVEVTNKAGVTVTRTTHVLGFCKRGRICAFCYSDTHDHSSKCVAKAAAPGFPEGFKP